MAKKEKPKSTFNVPKLTDEQVAQLQSDNEELRQMCLLNVFDKSLPAIPKDYMFKLRDRRMIELTHQAAYEMNGGVLWEAEWARQNPDKFFDYRARLLPQTNGEKTAAANQLTIINNVPTNRLDDTTIVNGQVIDLGDNVALDEELPGEDDI